MVFSDNRLGEVLLRSLITARAFRLTGFKEFHKSLITARAFRLTGFKEFHPPKTPLRPCWSVINCDLHGWLNVKRQSFYKLCSVLQMFFLFHVDRSHKAHYRNPKTQGMATSTFTHCSRASVLVVLVAVVYVMYSIYSPSPPPPTSIPFPIAVGLGCFVTFSVNPFLCPVKSK